LQIAEIGDVLKQATLLGPAFDRAAELHATLILFLLLAGFGAGLIRAIEVTSHFISP